MDFDIELKKKVDAEKQAILNCDNGTQHQHRYDEWKKYLGILNLIFKQTPIEGFGNESYIERQPLVFDYEQLTEEKKKMFDKVMQDLFHFDLLIHGNLTTIGKVSNYDKKKAPAVITSRLAEELMTGKNVAISDSRGFDKYRTEIKNLCNFGLFDGKQRFPKLYGSQFYISYKTRAIIINDCYILSHPDFHSTNDNFFDYVYSHPNQKINRDEVNSSIDNKSFHQILKDLKFKGEIRKLFFPNVSKTDIEFRNYLDKIDIKKLNVDEKKLRNELNKLEIIGKIKKQ
jgi:hypothetical protein